MRIARWIPRKVTSKPWIRNEDKQTEYKAKITWWTWRDRVYLVRETRLTEDLPAWGRRFSLGTGATDNELDGFKVKDYSAPFKVDVDSLYDRLALTPFDFKKKWDAAEKTDYNKCLLTIVVSPYVPKDTVYIVNETVIKNAANDAAKKICEDLTRTWRVQE